jgi:hypothetical protein
MSKLQNDFTTPEQSKRLLELGVPADSANCYYVAYNDSEDYEISVRTKGDTGNAFFKVVSYIPCWSVGRLIEILEIVLGSPWSDKELLGKQGTLLERVVSDFEDVVKYKEIFKDNRIDFSKLEG